MTRGEPQDIGSFEEGVAYTIVFHLLFILGTIACVVGLAVLGTSLSVVHKEYLSQFSTAIVALDPDALPKTMQFAKELRPFVNTVKVLKLTDDLKMRKEIDITNLKNAGV